MKTGTFGLSPVASAMALDRMEAEEEQSSATDAKQKLLEGMPKFKFYRRRKTNRAPRKRTFIMHMTKTPDALIETVGAQRAAGGGGCGGKKRRHAALLGSDATSGGFHTGIGKEEPVIPAPAFSPFAAYSLNDLAPEVSNPSPASVAVSASSSAAPFTSPFASFTVGAVSVVGAASVSRLSPFASALAQALPAAVGLPPVLDPLSDSFMVPNKYGSSSDLAPAVVTAAGSSFAACITLSGAGSAAEAAAPQAKRSRRDAASESAPLRFALPGSEGSMIECDHSLGAGAFGTVWRGMLDSQPVAVKFPLGSDRPISPALSREGSGNSTFTFFGSAPSFGSFPSFPASAASNVSPLPSSALGLGLSDSEDGVTASEVAATFENELRALAAAGPHPHVVRAIAAQLGPSPCLVMELAPWGSLADYLAQRQSRDWAALERTVLSRLAADLGHADMDSLLATVEARSAGQLPLPATRYLVALALLAQAAEGAAHLHRAGVVHRDIKPDNILIDSAGNARLADLGLARVASEGADALQLPTATPQFAAPEDLRGEDVTDRADTFSLANCVWQVLAGTIPWEGLAAASVMYRVGHAGATLAVPEAWPVAVRGLLAAAWQQQAAARPASAEVSAALSAELRRFVA